MLRPPATQRPALHLLARSRPHLCITHTRTAPQARTLFGWFKKSKPAAKKEPVPVLSQDDLFHPFSQSPFPALSARGEAIQKLAPCPVCAVEAKGAHDSHVHTHAQPKAVKFECPDCGWPTHCSEEHWEADTEHKKYCSKLREVNEDEHDLRSGRRMKEFELPGTGYVSTAQDTLIALYFTSRPSGLRGCHFVRELGRLLVHPKFPVHGHGPSKATR